MIIQIIWLILTLSERFLAERMSGVRLEEPKNYNYSNFEVDNIQFVIREPRGFIVSFNVHSFPIAIELEYKVNERLDRGSKATVVKCRPLDDDMELDLPFTYDTKTPPIGPAGRTYFCCDNVCKLHTTDVIHYNLCILHSPKYGVIATTRMSYKHIPQQSNERGPQSLSF